MVPYTDVLNAAGWFHVGYYGVLLPALAVRRRKKLLPEGQPLPERLSYYRKTVVGLVMLTTLSLLVARVQWVPLFPRSLPPAHAVLAGLATYAAFVAFMRPRWRRAVERRPRVVHLYMPANARERTWWVAVSVLAGVGEEITWRGVQAALLIALTDNFWIAAILCSVSFALTHIIQGWRSVVVIAVFAMSFHALVWLAGSLYVAMTVHVAYDITAGLTYGRLGRLLPPESSDSAPVGDMAPTP